MKQKKIIIVFNITIIVCILLNLKAIAQAPDWAWAKSAVGTNLDYANSVATDNLGNVYAVGLFTSDSITFGSTTLINYDTTYNSYDIFIVKYSAGGNVIWAKSFGGDFDDDAFSVAVDATGNVYVAGIFRSDSITFGSNILINHYMPSPAIFIVKCNADGDVLWAKNANGSYYVNATSVAIDAECNVFVAGDFNSPTIIFGSDTLTRIGGADMFIVKYDSIGNVLWAKRAGGVNSSNYSCLATGISSDNSGNSYVVGYFSNDILAFDSTIFINLNPGFNDIFIVKYDPNGKVLWAKTAGGNAYDWANSVAVNKYGDVYVAGQYGSDSITFGPTTLVNFGLDDIFLVKYDSSGNIKWAKSTGGTEADNAYSVAADTSGNAYLAGWFKDDTIAFGTTTLTNNGIANIFIAKYDTSGNVIWAKSAGGNNLDYANSVAVNSSGNAYITGTMGSPSITFGSDVLTNAGVWDMFIAKLDATAGIEEIVNGENNINVYPNPTDGAFTISYGTLQPSIYIYNCLGKLVYKKEKASQGCEQINLSAYSKGIYFIKMQSGEKSYSKKVILE